MPAYGSKFFIAMSPPARSVQSSRLRAPAHHELLRESRLLEESHDPFIGRSEPFHEEPAEVRRSIEAAQGPIDRQAKVFVATPHREGQRLIGEVALEDHRGPRKLRCGRRRRGEPANRQRARSDVPSRMLWTPFGRLRPERRSCRAGTCLIRSLSQLRSWCPRWRRTSSARARCAPETRARSAGSRLSVGEDLAQASGEVALRTAPVPLGKIGIEKETSARRGSASPVSRCRAGLPCRPVPAGAERPPRAAPTRR